MLLFIHVGKKKETKLAEAKRRCESKQILSVWIPMKNENYFTIQLIFATILDPTTFFGTIHGPHCIISVNF